MYGGRITERAPANPSATLHWLTLCYRSGSSHQSQDGSLHVHMHYMSTTTADHQQYIQWQQYPMHHPGDQAYAVWQPVFHTPSRSINNRTGIVYFILNNAFAQNIYRYTHTFKFCSHIHSAHKCSNAPPAIVCFELSVPVQVIALKDLSPKWPIMCRAGHDKTLLTHL